MISRLHGYICVGGTMNNRIKLPRTHNTLVEIALFGDNYAQAFPTRQSHRAFIKYIGGKRWRLGRNGQISPHLHPHILIESDPWLRLSVDPADERTVACLYRLPALFDGHLSAQEAECTRLRVIIHKTRPSLFWEMSGDYDHLEFDAHRRMFIRSMKFVWDTLISMSAPEKT